MRNARIKYLKISIKLFFLCIFLMVTGNYITAQEKGNTYIVSTDGSDVNPGTFSRPLATIEAARDAARSAEPGNHRIIIMPGDYYLTRPIELDARDNGLTLQADTNGKVTIYGGTPVTGWKPDGDRFWYVDLPEVKEGTWDFRALVVNGRLPVRARMPESGTLEHRQNWDVKVLPAIAGYWERQPTLEDLTVMAYDPKDIPQDLDVKNAELRVYHMWKESFVGIKYNDIKQNKLIFSSPAVEPPGAYGIKRYIIFNTREGMTKPGQWYLDRSRGRLVYWPLEGEDMQAVKVIAPRMEHIIRIAGNNQQKARNITIQGLSLQATTIPLQSAGFGGRSFDGALSMSDIHQCTFEELEISNVGGMGISGSKMSDVSITNCHVFNTGAACLNIGGEDLVFAYNHIHNAGIYYPSSAAMGANGTRIKILRNEIHDAPYSGMIIGRSDIVAEENLIYRVMTEVHDGAAIYSSRGTNITMRGNIIRDIAATGKGFGASALYIDEGASHCLIEKNITMGVARPILSHISRNSIIRDNVFINDDVLTLHFQSSGHISFEGNTVVTPGDVIIKSGNAVTSWKNNRLVRRGEGNDSFINYVMDFGMPDIPAQEKKNWNIEAVRSVKAPTIDGEMATDEWPGNYFRLDREPSRQRYTGAPVMMKYSWDDKYLYIGGVISMFDNDNISIGDSWGQDDGVEISIAGFEKGKPVTFVIRSYANGTFRCITDAGCSETAAEKLAGKLKYASKIKDSRGWTGEWAVPFDAIGLKPASEMKVAFNMCAFVNEYHNWHCWEGTLGESWQVDKAGKLLLSDISSEK